MHTSHSPQWNEGWTRLGAIALSAVLLAVPSDVARAGGPLQVAGTSFFDPAAKGAPLIWAQGSVSYYTDQGALSPALDPSAADTLVADAFSRWTAIPTVALAAVRAGQLAEDVNGSNVTASGTTIVMPADIQPGAVAKPVGIVYDVDGQVTDALLGTGASSDCIQAAVLGGPDNFSSDAHLTHALVVLNGICVQNASQVADFRYRLVRTLGRVLGLGWSQVNINVWTGIAKTADLAGFPILHARELQCQPTVCLPNADQPRLDDRAALGRLYPVTAQNQGSFPGKQPLAANTARIHGVLSFANAARQPMQGVNVVARWIDATGQPSRTYAASSVSGFLFRGNAGNAITGGADPAGQAYDRFGSDDAAVEGLYDLAGLEFPAGGSSAQYELSVEAVNGLWSDSVGPYGPTQVQPSGTVQPVVVTVTRGGDVTQDLVMTGSAATAPDAWEPESFAAPVPVPGGGDWMASLNGYGDADFYWLTGQANRTLSVEVTAVDEAGNPSQDKTQPVVGMWSLAAPEGTPPPAFSPAAFNTYNFGMTRLDAQLLASTDFRIGVADFRGDGRPDFRYHARVFYGDTVVPARAGVAGGSVLTLRGLGFRSGTAVSVGATPITPLSLFSNQILFRAPALPDGVRTISLADPATGAASQMTDVLTYGAGPNDTLHLIPAPNPAIPVGSETVNPVQLEVLEPDGVTPVAGATVSLDASAGGLLSGCGYSASCTVLSDASGWVSTHVRVAAAGGITITARLAPASYANPATAQTTVVGVVAALDIALTPQYSWLAGGTAVNLPLTALVLNSGSPLAGRTVNYKVEMGSATLSATTAVSDANGYVTATVQIAQMIGEVQVSACVAPGNSPCRVFYLEAVPAAALQMQLVSGSAQVVAVGQPFQPVVVRVTDAASPPNPVRGAPAAFLMMIRRPDTYGQAVDRSGEAIATHHAMPAMLGSSQGVLQSDAAGLVSLVPSAGLIGGPVEIVGTITVPSGAVLPFEVEAIDSGASGGGVARGLPRLHEQ